MNNKQTLLFTVLLTTILVTGCSDSPMSPFSEEYLPTASSEPSSLEGPSSDMAEEALPEAAAPKSATPVSQNEQKTHTLSPMIMVNDALYIYTGSLPDTEARCGMMDGRITSESAASEIPSQNGQSNFGTGYGYQYGAGAGIDVYMPYGDSDEMSWLHFVKANPVSEGSKDILLTSAPSLTLRNYLTDDLLSLTLRSGNYSWNYGTNDEMTAQIACGVHPLDEAKLHPSALEVSPLTAYSIPTFSFSFAGNIYPDSLTIRKWSHDDIDDTQTQPLTVSTFLSPFPLLELEAGYVYEITAEWKQENTAQNGCYGTASYVLLTE